MGKNPPLHKLSEKTGSEAQETKTPKDAQSGGEVFDAKNFSKNRDAFIEMLSQYPEFESCW